MTMQHGDSISDVTDHMTNSTGKLRREHAFNLPAEQAGQQILPVAVRLWGFDESEAQSWPGELPLPDGLLAWSIARNSVAEGAPLVVHLVKPSLRADDAFCWNCVGANYAMTRALDGTHAEIVLFVGDAAELPRRRVGFWAVAGKLPAPTALHAMAYLIGASAVTGHKDQFGVRGDVLAMIAQRLDV
jgi:hypothetical protein